jgi:hypothetical protein
MGLLEVSHGLILRNDLFLNEPPRSQGGRRGKGANAGRERLAERLDRPTPCPGDRSCEIGVTVFLPLSSLAERKVRGSVSRAVTQADLASAPPAEFAAGLGRLHV